MITQRDKQMIRYLQEYKCAHTQTLAGFYPNIKIARKRLKILYDSREIGRVRDNINAEYIYYLSKPKQLRHAVILTDFMREFSRVARVEKCLPEFVIGNVRADALIGYRHQNKPYIAFVEVQISNAPLDVLKYEKLYHSGAWKSKLPDFPLIIAITDRKIPKTDLKILRINEDLTNLV